VNNNDNDDVNDDDDRYGKYGKDRRYKSFFASSASSSSSSSSSVVKSKSLGARLFVGAATAAGIAYGWHGYCTWPDEERGRFHPNADDEATKFFGVPLGIGLGLVAMGLGRSCRRLVRRLRRRLLYGAAGKNNDYPNDYYRADYPNDYYRDNCRTDEREEDAPATALITQLFWLQLAAAVALFFGGLPSGVWGGEETRGTRGYWLATAWPVSRLPVFCMGIVGGLAVRRNARSRTTKTARSDVDHGHDRDRDRDHDGEKPGNAASVVVAGARRRRRSKSPSVSSFAPSASSSSSSPSPSSPSSSSSSSSSPSSSSPKLKHI
jgi:hypothetical protein